MLKTASLDTRTTLLLSEAHGSKWLGFATWPPFEHSMEAVVTCPIGGPQAVCGPWGVVADPGSHAWLLLPSLPPNCWSPGASPSSLSFGISSVHLLRWWCGAMQYMQRIEGQSGWSRVTPMWVWAFVGIGQPCPKVCQTAYNGKRKGLFFFCVPVSEAHGHKKRQEWK